MWASVDLPTEKSLYTNDDSILVRVVVRQEPEDTNPPHCAISRVEVGLICESKITVDEIERHDVHHFGETSPAPLMTFNANEKLAIYSCQLRFPSQATSEGEPLLGTLVLDDNEDGFHWFVRANIYPQDMKNCSSVLQSVETACQFVPTAPLPPMLDIIDTEHLEVIENTPISIVVTHAVVGLPQTPLNAGIGLRVACGVAEKFSVSRIRLILKETTTINRINGFKGAKKVVAVERWLLDDIHPSQPIPLSQTTCVLDYLVEDISIDFDSIHPSFETQYFSHNFDLMAEFTLNSGDIHDRPKTNRVVAVSPVEILPKIQGTKFKNYENALDALSWNSVEYTDSSEDDLCFSEMESDEETMSIQLPYTLEKDIFSVQEVPLIHSVH